jgi:hypothetical protein
LVVEVIKKLSRWKTFWVFEERADSEKIKQHKQVPALDTFIENGLSFIRASCLQCCVIAGVRVACRIHTLLVDGRSIFVIFFRDVFCNIFQCHLSIVIDEPFFGFVVDPLCQDWLKSVLYSVKIYSDLLTCQWSSF